MYKTIEKITNTNLKQNKTIRNMHRTFSFAVVITCTADAPESTSREFNAIKCRSTAVRQIWPMDQELACI